MQFAVKTIKMSIHKSSAVSDVRKFVNRKLIEKKNIAKIKRKKKEKKEKNGATYCATLRKLKMPGCN